MTDLPETEAEKEKRLEREWQAHLERMKQPEDNRTKNRKPVR